MLSLYLFLIRIMHFLKDDPKYVHSTLQSKKGSPTENLGCVGSVIAKVTFVVNGFCRSAYGPDIVL